MLETGTKNRTFRGNLPYGLQIEDGFGVLAVGRVYEDFEAGGIDLPWREFKSDLFSVWWEIAEIGYFDVRCFRMKAE